MASSESGPPSHHDPFIIIATNLTYKGKLGGGANGIVHLASLRNLDGSTTEVAVKKIPKLSGDKDDKDRIEQEKEILFLRRLNHPNVIEFIGTVLDCNELVLVTEYASKGSLYDYLKNERENNRKLPQDQVYDWAIQAARAIRYLQEMNVTHRDIKSPNFVITAKDVLKLCDFGLAKDLSVSVSIQSIKGMFRYITLVDVALDFRVNLNNIYICMQKIPEMEILINVSPGDIIIPPVIFLFRLP